jgi:hypothetical protein
VSSPTFTHLESSPGDVLRDEEEVCSMALMVSKSLRRESERAPSERPEETQPKA